MNEISVEYKLIIHSRDVFTSSDYDKHTGYDLVKYENRIPVNIQSVDLYNDNGQVKFDIRDQIVATSIYYSIGEIVGSRMLYDGDDFWVTSQWLLEKQYHASTLLTGEDALRAFNQMKLEAQLLNEYSSGIDYDLIGRNCNSSTQYFADKYLGGRDVFEDLTGMYLGRRHNFTRDGNGAMSAATTNMTIDELCVVDNVIAANNIRDNAA